MATYAGLFGPGGGLGPHGPRRLADGRRPPAVRRRSPGQGHASSGPAEARCALDSRYTRS